MVSGKEQDEEARLSSQKRAKREIYRLGHLAAATKGADGEGFQIVTDGEIWLAVKGSRPCVVREVKAKTVVK